MSVTHEMMMACEQCEAEQPFVLRMHIDMAVWPEGKEELLSRRLNMFVCSKCGFSQTYDFVLLYEDRKKRLIVMSSPLEGDPILKPEFAHFADEFELRRVSSRNQLIEKIVIRDAKLDDRVVEYVKVQLRNESLRRSMPIDGELMFSGLAKDEEGERVLEFQDFTGDKNDVFFGFPLKLYRMFARDMKPYIEKMPKQETPWLRIDREYGKQLERLLEKDVESMEVAEKKKKPRGKKGNR